jgi:lysophospholipase L1-like esterase
MKRVLVIASLILNLSAIAFVTSLIQGRGGVRYLHSILAGDTNPGKRNPAYAQRTSIFATLPLKLGAVIFAGDSITAGFEWGEALGPHVLNRGIGGDTSHGLLQRTDDFAFMRPRAVFVMIGTNDWVVNRTSPEETARNYAEIVEKIHKKSPGTIVYLQSILPSASPKKNEWVGRANALIKPLGNGKSVVYVDLYHKFLAGDRLNPALTSDGIHLNGTGYSKWLEILQGCCREALEVR